MVIQLIFCSDFPLLIYANMMSLLLYGFMRVKPFIYSTVNSNGYKQHKVLGGSAIQTTNVLVVTGAYGRIDPKMYLFILTL